MVWLQADMFSIFVWLMKWADIVEPEQPTKQHSLQNGHRKLNNIPRKYQLLNRPKLPLVSCKYWRNYP
jgi:hypothetical protein